MSIPLPSVDVTLLGCGDELAISFFVVLSICGLLEKEESLPGTNHSVSGLIVELGEKLVVVICCLVVDEGFLLLVSFIGLIEVEEVGTFVVALVVDSGFIEGTVSQSSFIISPSSPTGIPSSLT